MKYTDRVRVNELPARFKKSSLSFKYELICAEKDENTKGETVIAVTLAPTGYNNRKYFTDGKYAPELVENRKISTVIVSDFEVSSKDLPSMTNEDKKDLLEIMHKDKPYFESYCIDYKEHHRLKVDAAYTKELEKIEFIKSALFKTGKQNVYEYLKLKALHEKENKIFTINQSFNILERKI